MPEEQTQERLMSIDLLRGIAVVMVVIFHARVDYFYPHGQILFFVISGFCVHLRFAKSFRRTGTPPAVPFWSSVARRFGRLYFPYLVALLLSLYVAYLFEKWHPSAFGWYDLAVHAVMLHNFDAHTVYSINQVLWTFAISEQLFLAYFILLQVRQYLAWKWVLVAILGLHVYWFTVAWWLAELFHLPLAIRECALVHWFSWTLGALAVESYYGHVRLAAWLTDWRTGLALLTGVYAMTVLANLNYLPRPLGVVYWVAEAPLWGCAYFVLVNAMAASERLWKFKFATLSAPVVAVGLMSYSLYLVHMTFILTMSHLGWQASMEETSRLGSVIVLLFGSLVLAWIFYLTVERPANELRGEFLDAPSTHEEPADSPRAKVPTPAARG